ncbi:MAG: patatin-like phospholipase family protein [Methylobacteriaceae bacterium]|nr:patatin-like phospholipase family protein [Methylobacteriaceae bacterium]
MNDAQPLDSAAIGRAIAPYHCVALALQGGGALGAYQAGVYETLHGAGVEPTWISGVSIGAINAALIAGNAPERRVARLAEFWRRVTSGAPAFAPFGDVMRRAFNLSSAFGALAAGAPGFFSPRPINPWLLPAGAAGATSFYDTAPLRATLEELVDWDRLNSGAVRLSVGAVNVRSGNFRFFDTAKERLGPEHVMASGALPPGFPAVVIDNEAYWDGGVVSNTPLQYVLEFEALQDTLIFQVDLFSARGEAPRDMTAVLARQKEILYSSRTRNNTDAFRRTHTMRARLRAALKRLPAQALSAEDRNFLAETEETPQVGIVHLIYQRATYEEQSQDYEFSGASMRDHWAAGRADTTRTLRHPRWLEKPGEMEAVRVHDVHRDEPA